MHIGTASHKLRKMIMFVLIRQCGIDYCYRCDKVIDDIDTLSVEHIEPWLDTDDPVKNFFDLNNIAFSHLACNVKDAKQPDKGKIKHPSLSAYVKGCRCDECKELQKLRARDYNRRKRQEL